MIYDEAKCEIDRRAFLRTLYRLAAVACISNLLTENLLEMVSANENTSTNHIFAFGDEARWPSDTNFTIGFLFTQHPRKHRHHLHELRKKHGYWRTFKYVSTDKYKVPYAIALLSYFAKEPDLRYVAQVVGQTENGEKLHYKSFANQLSPQKLKLSLTLKTSSRVGGGKEVREYLKREVKRIESISVVRRREDDLMQLADFITGNVALDAAQSSKSPVKLEMLMSLHKQLNVSSLLASASKDRNKFRVLQ